MPVSVHSPRHHSSNVRVDDGVSLPMGEDRNGARGVLPDARQGEKLIKAEGNLASVRLDNGDGAGVESKCSSRVSEPAPGANGLPSRRRGEIRGCRPAFEPRSQGSDDTRDGSLLEHHFAHEDAPCAISVRSPRQVTGVAPIPRGDGVRERETRAVVSARRRRFTHAHYSRHMARSVPSLKDQLKSLAEEIVHNYGHGRTLVAVDGRHGAGQGEFAEALAGTLSARGLKVFHARIDDFFRPRSHREREGWLDGEAHYREAYDYSLLRRVLIDPFRTSGSTGFVLTGFDEVRDEPVFQPKWMSAGPDAILILDGVFLHRPELSGTWNYSVWLSTPPLYADGPEQVRNIASDAAYLSTVKPDEAATAVFDNRDPEHPVRIFVDSC